MPSAWLLVLVAAFLVAFLHAILPDHWMPIALLARTQHWNLRKALRVAAWAGFGHIACSLVLGVVLIALGFGLEQTFSAFSHVQGQFLVAY